MTQSKKYIQPFGAVLAISIGFILLMSTAAMLPSQAAVTPTLETTATSTEQPTSTPTASQTSTSTLTLTPSATPTYSIPEPLQTEIANVNEKLDDLKQNPFSTHGANIFDNLLSSLIVVVWTALVGLVKRLLKLKNEQDESAGRALQRGYVNLEAIFGDVFHFSKWLSIGLLIIWAVYQINDSISRLSKAIELSAVANPTAIPLNSATPYPTTSPTPYPTSTLPNGSSGLLLSSVKPIGVFVIFFFIFIIFASIISRNQAKIFESILPKHNMNVLGKKLLPAIFLVIILQLLPNPIDTFLLPVLIPFILLAFFDIVLLYPNSHLQSVVKRHYSKIIFWSVFFVWLGALQKLQSYLNSILNMIDNDADKLTIYSWVLLPYVISFIYASRSSRQIRRVTKEKYIAKINETGSSKSE